MTVLIIIVFAETGLMAGFFLPGDSLLVTAGLLSSIDGVLDIRWMIFSLSAAAIIGDQTGYVIGRFIGPKLYSREDSFFFRRSHLIRTEKFFDKYGAKTIVLARFVPIVRTFAPTVAGVAKMNYRRFVIYNIAGGIGWVASMTLLGYFLGAMIPDIEKKIHYIIAVVIVVSFLPIFHEWWVSRKNARVDG